MRNPVIAIVLCFLAAAAGAQCVAEAPVADTGQPRAGWIGTSAPDTRMQRELPMDDEEPPVLLREAAPEAKRGDDQPRRSGPAMVLAVVAVMSGIALRRYGARLR